MTYNEYWNAVIEKFEAAKVEFKIPHYPMKLIQLSIWEIGEICCFLSNGYWPMLRIPEPLLSAHQATMRILKSDNRCRAQAYVDKLPNSQKKIDLRKLF